MPAFNYGFPSNAMEFFSIIVPIVNYDIIHDVPVYTDALNSISSRKETPKSKKRALSQSGFSYKPADSSVPRIPSQVISLGYYSHNPLINMGTTTLVLMIYFCRIIFLVLVVLPLYKCRNKHALKFFPEELKRLFFR